MVDGNCALAIELADCEIKVFGPAPLRCRADSFWAIETSLGMPI